jgi:hypothetical protein
MSYNLILNNTNVASQNNNIYKFDFVNGSFSIKDDAEICISSVTIPYAWFNITSALNNNVFTITDWLGGLQTITLSNGFYTVADVNLFLQNYFLNNGMYLIDNNGLAVVYVYMATNTSAYANQILTYAVPTSLPAGWSLPTVSTWIGFPATTTAPTVNILNNGFQQFLGYTAGSYGGGSSDSSFLSNITPNATTVNSIIVRCSVVNNPVSMPSDVLDTIPINATFGANIDYTPAFQKFVKVSNGTYSTLTVTFVDQNFNTIQMLDNNVAISLLLKN